MIKKIVFVFTLCILAIHGYSQASWEQFSQNRVQYRTFEWRYYDSTHFRTFYYDYGNANALYALNIAEQELSHIVYMMGGRLNKKLNIIIYNSFSDYHQTNIGRQNDAINKANGGKVAVATDNIPIYFNGDHNHLKKQLRKGISSVIKDNMLYGDNIKDVVKNAVKMNLPEWYTLGYVSYISDDWKPKQEVEVNSLLTGKKKNKFNDLSILYPELIGHSFWNFVANQYGENYISNLLYLTRFRKSVNNAIESVFKKPAEKVYAEWEAMHAMEIEKVNLQSDSLDGRIDFMRIKTKRDVEYSQIVVSTDGDAVAYVERKDGEFHVVVQNAKFNKKFTIVDGGIKAVQSLTDPEYPFLVWSPSGKKLAVLYQKNNSFQLRIFTAGKRKMENRVIPPRKIERITGLCFMQDENYLAVTGIKKGQSDLFSLALKNNKVENITKDLFDDKNPILLESGAQNGILFLSNRNNPFIGEGAKSDDFTQQFNLYLYNPKKGTNLIPLSNTLSEITSPMPWGQEEFSYLLEEKGKLVRHIVRIQKNGTERDTFQMRTAKPVPFALLKQDYILKSAEVVEVTKSKSDFIVYKTPFQQLQDKDQAYQALMKDSLLLEVPEPVPTPAVVTYSTPFEKDTTSIPFLEEIFLAKNKKTSRYQLFTAKQNTIKPKKHLTTFYPDFIQTSLDNTLLFTRYQPFAYNGGQVANPPLSGFLTSSLTDIMEDYKITGGMRLGADFHSLDYFMQFANYRKRTDWGMLYYHHAVTNTYDYRYSLPPAYSPYPVYGKVGLDYLQSNFTYPFDMLQSIRMQLGIRYDRIRIQAKDKYSIGIPDDKQYWVTSRLEYVYDNSYSPIINIWKGTKAKLFTEYQYKINGTVKGFYNFGFDGRNYIGLYKNCILASRIASAFSGGNAKILYFLGGVDNDLNPQQDANTGIDPNANYAFQSLATNMRGYKQGTRNGNSYMLVNEEIRLPVYNTFFKKQIKSGFIRNLQLVAFSDIGSAWRGLMPNSDNIKKNNKVQDPNSPVIVYIDNPSYDFAWGYGLGMRTKLLGYFFRTDFAWNIEGSKKPMVHVSLATDF